MIKKKNQYIGLSKFNTYIVDNTDNSLNYFNIISMPNEFSAGKNVIRILANKNNLVKGSQIHVEVLDYNGDPVYYEIPNYIDDDKSRLIVVYVYEDTPPGEATITILGEAKRDQTGKLIPEEYRGSPNLKWQKKLEITPDKRNDNNIIITSDPNLSITEIIKSTIDYTKFPVTSSTGTIGYEHIGGNYQISSDGFSFIQDMIGGTVLVASPVNPEPSDEIDEAITPYTTSISAIESSNIAMVTSPYVIGEVYVDIFDRSSYELRYDGTPSGSATGVTSSYTSIRFGELEPISGDVHRIKVHYKRQESISGYDLLTDVILESSELLIDTGSINVRERTGDFTSQTVVDTYWDDINWTGSYGAVTATYQESGNLTNAVNVVPSYYNGYDSSVGPICFKLVDNYKLNFFKDVNYRLQFSYTNTINDGIKGNSYKVYFVGNSNRDIILKEETGRLIFLERIKGAHFYE